MKNEDKQRKGGFCSWCGLWAGSTIILKTIFKNRRGNPQMQAKVPHPIPGLEGHKLLSSALACCIPGDATSA
jgi:hypothetical protein